jgi:hypothetical protein
MKHTSFHSTLLLAALLLASSFTFYSCKTDDEPDWAAIDDSDNTSGDDQEESGTAQPTTVFYESFNNLNGHGGNDGYYDNDDNAGIEIAENDLEDASNLDNTTGWGDFIKVGICNKCVRLATKKNNGSITTPAFAPTTTESTLTFTAAAQLEDDVTLYVDIKGGTLTYNGTTASSIKIQLPATEQGKTVLADQLYTMTLTKTEENCSLTFSTISSSSSKQRAFLDEIKVTTK